MQIPLAPEADFEPFSGHLKGELTSSRTSAPRRSC
jgi:hypothetical protein